MEWDDRISHAIERAKKEKRERGLATGSEDQGSRKGVAVSLQEEKDKKEREEKEFDAMPYEYHPPRFGGRGKLPKDKIPHGHIGGKHNEIEHWMSGANGDRPDAPIDLTEPEEENPGLSLTDDNPETLPNGAKVINNVLDTEVEHWVGESLDDVYPFDHTAENLEYLNQTDRHLSPTNDLFDFGPSDHIDAADNAQYAVSHDQTDTNATEPPISFDLPSVVQESVQAGTQDISETQLAERAMGEFEEFVNLPVTKEAVNAGEPTTIGEIGNMDLGSSMQSKTMDNFKDEADNAAPTANTNVDIGSSTLSKQKGNESANAGETVDGNSTAAAMDNFNLGSSILGKRKYSPTPQTEAPKRVKHHDIVAEDQGLDFAVDESWDADEAYKIAGSAGLFGENGAGGENAGTMVLWEESGTFSTAVAGEGAEVGADEDMGLFGE